MIATHLKNIKSLKNRLDIGLTVTPRSFLTVALQYRVKAIAKLKSEIGRRIMKPCPINYNCESMSEVCINEFSGEASCKNEVTCEQYSLSWGLPYEYFAEENLLVVKKTIFRYFWSKEVLKMDRRHGNCKVCPINGMEAGNYIEAHSELALRPKGINIRNQIKIEMEQEGWMAAAPIESKPKVIMMEQSRNCPGFKILGNSMIISHPKPINMLIEIKREIK
jgi:hypothetical protein